MMHCTLWGTVYLHQGQELGMINLPQDWPLSDYKDCKTQNVVAKIRQRGVDVDALTRKVYHKARDNGRSPMQVSRLRTRMLMSVGRWRACGL
jgi:glycosidase